MRLREARAMAEALLAEHGLAERGWVFAWSHAKRTLGSASLKPLEGERGGAGGGRGRSPRLAVEGGFKKTLKLSTHHVRLNGVDVVRETLLHEVAHALTFERHLAEHGDARHEPPHGPTWRRFCVALGIEPARVAGPEVVVPAARFSVVCPACGRTLAARERRPSASTLRQGYCRFCGPATAGRLRLERSGA